MNRCKLFSLVVLVAATRMFASAQALPPQPEVEPTQSIASRAAAAKADGKAAVSFPSKGVSYPVAPDGLTHAVSEFTVVVGVPGAIQTVIEDGALIASWYSITISETIANHPCKMCSLLTADGLPKSLQPANLLPIAPHSMLLLRRGGAVTVDGVKITETENGVSALTIGEKYLFVVDKSPGGMARLVLNDAGIFSVGPDGRTLTPISGVSHTTSVADQKIKYPSLGDLRIAAAAAAQKTTPELPRSNGRSED